MKKYNHLLPNLKLNAYSTWYKDLEKKKIKHSEVTTFQLLHKVVSDKTSDGGVFIPYIKNVTMTY